MFRTPEAKFKPKATKTIKKQATKNNILRTLEAKNKNKANEQQLSEPLRQKTKTRTQSLHPSRPGVLKILSVFVLFSCVSFPTVSFRFL